MLSARFVRRFGTSPRVLAATTSVDKASFRSGRDVKPIVVDEPALFKLKNERDPDKLFSLFKANASNRLVVENRFAFEDTVARLAGAGRFDYIEDLLEQQKALPQGRREGFVLRIITLYARAGMTKHALDTFYNMHLYGSKRTVKSFNAALKVLTQSRDLGAIESFLSDVPFRFGIDLDVCSVNIVVKAFCEMNILEKAYIVMVEMEKLGIVPDVITYTTLISGFYRANRPEVANGLWNLMVLKGCTPNAVTFNARIQFLINKGHAWEANRLLAYMRNKRLADVVTYNLVIKGFCNAMFFEMAMRVYSALHDDGFKPNEKIYQTMIHYFCQAGEYALAYTMCKDSMLQNWFPSVQSINNLLEGLQKVDRLDKANHIFNLAVRRVPRFSAGQIETMKSILSKN